MRARLPELLARLREEQGQQQRAVLALVQLPPAGIGAPTSEGVAAALRAELVGPAELLVVREDEPTARRLAELNTGRDQLLRRIRAVVFVCETGAAARFLRRMAPDLTATFDLMAELDVTVELDGEELGRRLKEVQRQRFRELDLSGLVPHATDSVRLQLDAVFQRRALKKPQRGDLDEGGVGLLLAEPGAGKSTWLRHLALVPNPKQMVLYAPLGGWVAQARERELALLPWLESYAGELLGLPSIELGPHLAGMTLLLDGLDEVPTQGARRRLIEEALAMRQRHAGIVCILAGREHVIDDLLSEQLRKIRLLRFVPLEVEAQHGLVVALLRARRGLKPGEPLPTEVERLRHEVVHHADFARFGKNPLLLSFLTVLADLGRGIPTQRAELYGDLVEMLIVSWQKVRGGSTGRRLNRADVLRVVAPLGWRLVEQGLGGLTEPELLDFLVEIDRREADSEIARAAARTRLGQLREDSALLHASDGLWRFHHASIAEFLAARAVLQSPALLRTLCIDPYEPRRALVLAFALALSCDLEPRDDVALPLLHALDAKARRSGRYDARIPRVLASCLQEVHSMPEALRQHLAGHVLRIALCQVLRPAQRLEALNAVAVICRIADGPIRAALREAVAGSSSIKVEAIAASRIREFDDFWEWIAAEFVSLPLSIEAAGVSAAPLIQSWISHTSDEIRALAWEAWGQGSEIRQSLALRLDPDSAMLIFTPDLFSDREATSGEEAPAAWTAAIATAFPQVRSLMSEAG